MITAIAFETVVEVQVSGSTVQEYSEDLQRLTKDIPARDREFVEHRKAWKIIHPEVYKHLPYIAKALQLRENQLSLF